MGEQGHGVAWEHRHTRREGGSLGAASGVWWAPPPSASTRALGAGTEEHTQTPKEAVPLCRITVRASREQGVREKKK